MRAPAAVRVAAVLLLVSAASGATAALAQLTSLETDDLRLVYLDPTQSYLAPHAARCFENSMRFQRRLFDYTPWEKVTVLLKDLSDYGNAGASPMPRNYLGIEMAPMSFAFETYPSNERMNTLMNHELVHIAAYDQPAASDRFFRKLFAGKVLETPEHPETILYNYLTVPRSAAPRWYHEGIAVFVETWMAGGIGRAQGSYDEMVFRSMVRDGSRFYDPLGLVSEGTKIDFQLETNSYLYGTRFMSYLADRYSPESLIRWVSRSDGSKAYYSSQFKRVYGTRLDDAWHDWVAWEHDFQAKNLEAIRQHPLTPYKDLSTRALGSVSRAYFDPGGQTLYAAFNYPGVLAHLGAISVGNGALKRLRDIKGPMVYTVTSLAFDPDGKVLYYTTDNYALRDLVSLDLSTGKARTLIKDLRAGDLVYNRADGSLYGIRHYNGICTLIEIPRPYRDWKQIYSFDYGRVAYDLDISPDGSLLSASVGEASGQHKLEVMKLDALRAGDTTAVAELDFGTTIPSGFVFSPDGKYLYGSSYYTGVSNIFRFEVATKDLQGLTNCETGMFRPVPMDGDRLIVFRYTGEGFVPAVIDAKPIQDVSAITFFGQQLVEKHPVLKTWIVGSPRDIPLDSMVIRKEPYRPFRKLGLESWYPVVEGYKDSTAFGAGARLSDPLSLHQVAMTASYTPGHDLPSDERYHVSLRYQRYDWKAQLKLNAADFYDLFGPTKVSRKGYSAGVGYKRILLYDEPRNVELNVAATYYGNIDRLPDYQNVEATFDKLATLDARIGYRNLRGSLGAVDYEKGLKVEALTGLQYENGNLIPSAVANLDAGFALPLPHSSLWLRTSAGAAHGDLENPFANFFFGGFGNNYVDHGEVKRYRDYTSFPGVELNSISGKNFAKATFEWNLPPIRFRSVGSRGFYATWARSSIFATGIATNLDEQSARRKLACAGLQVDVRLTALARQDLTVSFGYGRAFESGLPSHDEFMASLKILR